MARQSSAKRESRARAGVAKTGPRRKPPASTPPRTIASVNPATGETLETFQPLGAHEIDERLGRAVDVFRVYRRTPFQERARLLLRAAEILEGERDELASLMTREMGKPIDAARQEASKCALGCRHYAAYAEGLLRDEPVSIDGVRAFVRYQPLGPVLAVMPWNFPFWQVFRFAAPALMAGNVALLKHASNVPRCALAIEGIFRRAGLPEGAFQTLLIGSDAVERVIDDPRVVAATLTGSESAGSSVARVAGAKIKKTVLELGGSDPFIVMPSVDVDAAAAAAVQARTINNGQSCIAAKRFIVAEAIADAFQSRMVERMEALRVGDPMDPATTLGPLATEDIVATLDDQVRRSVAAGARVLTGGRRLDRPGFYYAPTVLTDVTAEAPAAREEMFGPVATLFRARDLDHALGIANDTSFGLGASIWTRDETEQARFVDEIESGLAFVNAMVASDPRLPFGGVKRSGYGRELARFGILEFVNVKTVWMKEDGESPQAETE